MTNQHDEQTELKLDEILAQYRSFWIDPRAQIMNTQQTKAALQAWSRQQTAQILDKLTAELGLDVESFGSIPSERVVAAIEALRVGLE